MAQTAPDGRPTESSFTRSALLRRFDGNRDGELKGAERRALRDAFGGIDVPMLPDEAHRYEDFKLPSYVERAALQELDNTRKDNPLTNHGATLGRVLFYDRQLSKNNTVACASCHFQKAGFADPRRFSVGYLGGHTNRNAMGLANLRFTNLERQRPGFFWDERAPTLEDQALMPIQDKVEMGMDLKDLEAKLAKLPYYRPLFQAAFGSPKVTRDRIARSVAQFLRSMVSFSSKYDQAAAKAAKAGDANGDFADFTRQENLGKELFMNGLGGITEFACAMCHVPPTFNMSAAANNGLDLKYADRGLGDLGRPSNDPFTPNNDGKFKAPSLRNIELTAPYMHDGRFKTLGEVINHYSGGIHPHPNLGLAFIEENRQGATTGLGFNDEQKAALIAFLKTLTDRRFASDERFSDPFIRLDAPAVRTLKGHTSRVNHVAFGRTGKGLASGGHDRTVKETGSEITTLKEHADSVNSVAFSPDGRWLASGSDDHTIKLWDVRSLVREE